MTPCMIHEVISYTTIELIVKDYGGLNFLTKNIESHIAFMASWQYWCGINQDQKCNLKCF